jgi:hypothetical protein
MCIAWIRVGWQRHRLSMDKECESLLIRMVKNNLDLILHYNTEPHSIWEAMRRLRRSEYVNSRGLIVDNEGVEIGICYYIRRDKLAEVLIKYG